ncbi:MAG: tyrosine-type recombinase/integrase [Chloroflexi bacterium]|nr:tyrosine-type recombinase/integrase [Chloroflexota bacterium]
MELERAIQSFLQDVVARDLSGNTHKRYAADLGNLAAFLQPRSITLIEQITTEHLRAYFADLHERPNGRRPDTKLSPYSIEGMYRTFKTFFRFCECEEYLAQNPMVRIRKPKLPDRIVPRLSEEQVVTLLNEVEHTQSPERNLALLMLMVNNGLRRGEVLGLTIDNVYLDEDRIRVTGKGRKDRDVPLGESSALALCKWLAVRPASLVKNVFLNADGSAFKAPGVRSLFQRLQIHAGLKRLYPHLLRHTFAKLYLKRVRDVKSLQQILGHSKSSTTLDLYVEYDFNDLIAIYRDGSPVDAIKKALIVK